MSTHARTASAVFVCFVLLPMALAAQDPPSRERGFSAETAYALGDLDSVNLFNGNLTVTIPIGQRYPVSPALDYGLTAVYNSNVWRLDSVQCYQSNPEGSGIPLGLETVPNPDPIWNAGLGWSVHLGQLYAPNVAPFEDSDEWIYLSPDGGQHAFYPYLHPGTTTGSGVGNPGELYTADGTYLRMRTGGCDAGHVGGACRLVEEPGGRIREFRDDDVGDWKLTRIRDGHGNFVDVKYPADGNTWRIVDQHGREQKIKFDDGRVDYITVTAFDGETATWDFQYLQETIPRQNYFAPTAKCNDNPGDFPARMVSVQTLTQIVQPTGWTYDMTYHLTDVPDPNLDHLAALSGGLATLITPIEGKLAWNYGKYDFKSQDPDVTESAANSAFSVFRRRTFLKADDTSPYAEWQYEYAANDNPGYPGDQQDDPPCYHKRTVIDPLGNTTEHFFQTVKLEHSWAYGLPFTYCHPDSAVPDEIPATGPFLSQRQYQGAATSGNLVREVFVDYTADGVLPLTTTPWNPRQTEQRVVYLDDTYDAGGEAVGHQRTTTFTNNDGYGNWRTTSVSGSYGSTKTTTTDYNGTRTLITDPLTSRQIAGSNFQMPGPGARWLWRQYTDQQITEGGQTTRRQVCMGGQSGLLMRERTLAADSRTSRDIVRVITRNVSDGFPTQEAIYGGDDQSVNTGGLCGLTLPPEPEYLIQHTYSSGALSRSVYVEPSDDSIEVLQITRQDIDTNTGLPSKTYDVSDLSTEHSYDSLGRPLYSKPQEGAVTRYAYHLTDLPDHPEPRVEVWTCPQGNTTCLTTQSLQTEYHRFDKLGRRVGVTQSMPGESTAETESRKFTYNELGWKTSEGTWIKPGGNAKFTIYSGYDRFGRVGSVDPPGGNNPPTVFEYEGDRVTHRQYRIRIDSDNTPTDRFVCTTEERDHHGRLLLVEEGQRSASGAPCASADDGLVTTYDYDEADRLTLVCQNDNGSSCGQTREFTYDGRGLLTGEKHPEIGPIGNGWTNYTYDSLGNVRTKAVAGASSWNLEYHYDSAGRLRLLEDAADRPNKQFFYGRKAGRSKGKLVQAIRHNWRDFVSILGPATSGGHPAIVSDRYEYNGKGGRVSAKTTSVQSHTDHWAWRSSWAYDDLGVVTAIGYPECLTFNCSEVTPPRTQTFGSTNGFTTSITDIASEITYQSGGMLHQVDFTNGTSWTQSINTSDGLSRPSSITSSGGSHAWSTGTYQYDGSGNIYEIGTKRYEYDQLNRLVTAKEGPTLVEQSAVFDDYGNLTSLTTGGATKALGVNAQTNRLTGQSASYDANGNLTGVTVDEMEYEYQYNPQNQMRYLQSERTARIYIYDANDERVWTWTCPRNDCVDDQGDLIEPTTMRFTMRGLNGEVLRVWEGTSTVGRNWVEDFVHLNGRPIAAIRNTATTPGEIDEQKHFFMVDHLGSVRQILDESGNQVGLYEYYPFGQEKVSISNAETSLKFTGHERDEENLDSGELDYMHARYCSPVLGRFLSIDPRVRRGPTKFSTRWNRYAYALGSPVKYVDRTGRDVEISTSGRVQAVRNMLARALTKPSFRQDFIRIANNHDFKLLVQDSRINSMASIISARRSGSASDVTFGRTNRTIKMVNQGDNNFVRTTDGAVAELDTSAIGGLHPDRTGVTTTAHEIVGHALDMMEGASDEEIEDTHGLVEQKGRDIAAEEADISLDEARELLERLVPEG